MKKIASLLSCAFALATAMPLVAQPINTTEPAAIRRCVTHELQYLNTLKNRDYGIAVQQTFDEAKQRANLRQDDTTIYRIPVVVHVLYNNADENISDEVVQSQIAKLNEDYRRQNADAANTREVFLDRAVDTRIEFYLAYLDPNGNQTTGITHNQTDRENFSIMGDIMQTLEGLGLTQEQITCLMSALATGDFEAVSACGVSLDVIIELITIFGGQQNNMDDMKNPATGGVAPWDTERYLNIWVCDLNGDDPSLGMILGFAYPPANLPNWPANSNGTAETDGVAIDFRSFGNATPNTQTLAPFADGGRTSVHEVGHYFGLRHIWGDGDCTQDDGIEDTPDAAAQTDIALACSESPNTCTEANDPQLPDMFENYMDYSSDECQNLFTRQQADLMRSVITGPRAGLLWQNSVVGVTPAPLANWDIKLQPNPTNNIATLTWNSTAPLHAIEIYNAAGARVMTLQPNSKSIAIDLSEQASGVYVLKTISGTQSQTLKLIKH